MKRWGDRPNLRKEIADLVKKRINDSVTDRLPSDWPEKCPTISIGKRDTM
jgi:hypothetical protein